VPTSSPAYLPGPLVRTPSWPTGKRPNRVAGFYCQSMRNPGYVHELAALYLDGRDPRTLATAQRNGVSDSELATAMAAPRAPQQ